MIFINLITIKLMNKLTDLEILLQLFPNKNWNYDWLSQNPNITWEIIKENSKKPWNFNLLSLNSNITWKIIKDNPYALQSECHNFWNIWNYWSLSKNSNITFQIVKDNPDISWNYNYLSQNPNVT